MYLIINYEKLEGEMANKMEQLTKSSGDMDSGIGPVRKEARRSKSQRRRCSSYIRRMPKAESSKAASPSRKNRSQMRKSTSKGRLRLLRAIRSY